MTTKKGEDLEFGYKRRDQRLVPLLRKYFPPEEWGIGMIDLYGKAMPPRTVAALNTVLDRYSDFHRRFNQRIGCAMYMENLQMNKALIMEARWATNDAGKKTGNFFWKAPTHNVETSKEVFLTELKAIDPVFLIINNREGGEIMAIAPFSYHDADEHKRELLMDHHWNDPETSKGNENRIVNASLSKEWSNILGCLIPRDKDELYGWFVHEMKVRKKGIKI